MVSSRRLQLATESTGTLGIALRRWRQPAEAMSSAKNAEHSA
jgi:protein ImuA